MSIFSSFGRAETSDHGSTHKPAPKRVEVDSKDLANRFGQMGYTALVAHFKDADATAAAKRDEDVRALEKERSDLIVAHDEAAALRRTELAAELARRTRFFYAAATDTAVKFFNDLFEGNGPRRMIAGQIAQHCLQVDAAARVQLGGSANWRFLMYAAAKSAVKRRAEVKQHFGSPNFGNVRTSLTAAEAAWGSIMNGGDAVVTDAAIAELEHAVAADANRGHAVQPECVERFEARCAGNYE